MNLPRISVLLGLSLVFSAVVAIVSPAEAAPTGLLDEATAMARAKSTRSPVVVSARTDETTLITADPETGMFVAELSARPVRVSDGAGGWRDASAHLVRASDGGWRTEAGVTPVRITGGGSGDVLASLGDESGLAELKWSDSLPEPVIDDTMATFSEVYPGVDLVVKADVDAVETYLVVKSAAAGRNPKVRNWSVPMATPGLKAIRLSDGTQSLVDSRGVEQIVVPRALMWDSTGKASDLLRTADRIEESVKTKSAEVGLKIADGHLNAQASDDFLDDPSTVYPVVIDPVLQKASQTQVLRVTNNWTKWGSAVGDLGKIGYNGWSSPYYKSRMFYQFKWPAGGLLPSQIFEGKFQYTQVHSVQHSPCLSTSSNYPVVRARLADAISSTDTWSDRVNAWHSPAAVSPIKRMAVGHKDYCKKAYNDVWDLTSQLKAERQAYAGRSTVTVGLRSWDEQNKNGWKYYYNKSGTSPKLYLTYQLAPQKPQAVSASPLKVAGTTWSPTPTLSAKLLLTSGDACVTTSCLKAEFVIKNHSGGTVATLTSGAVASGGTASVVAPSLANGQTYTVTVRAKSVDTGVYSASTTPYSLATDTKPGAPTNLKLTDENGVTATGSPIEVVTGLPKFVANLPGGAWCPGTTPACLTASFTVSSPGMSSFTLTSNPTRPGDLVSLAVPEDNALPPGSYTVNASTKHSITGQVGPTASLSFVRIPPKPPTPQTSDLNLYSDPSDPPDPSKTFLRLHVDNPEEGADYTWTTIFSPDDGTADQTSQVTGLQLDTQGDLEIPWNLAAGGTVSVTVICTAFGVDSDPSTPATTGLFY